MGGVSIFSFRYPTYNFLVIAVSIVTAIGLWASIHRTRFGVMLRATSQNRKMASALGINVGRVYTVATPHAGQEARGGGVFDRNSDSGG